MQGGPKPPLDPPLTRGGGGGGSQRLSMTIAVLFVDLMKYSF